MTKRRNIDPRLRASETFACLTYRQRDLWVGLILVCDDQGRMPGQTAYVRSAVWPYDDVQLADVESDLAALESLGNITRYRVEGRTFIQLVNWHKYQADAEWLGKSEYPAPEGWQDHFRYTGPKREIITGGRYKKDDDKGNPVPAQVPSAVPSAVPVLNDNDNDNENDNENDKEKENDNDNDTPQAAAVAFVGPADMQEARSIQARIRMETSKMCRVTGILETIIAEVIYKYPEDWIKDAIHTAIINGAPRWAYVEGVLENRAVREAASVKRLDYIDAVER
jgi:hypothetical protein